MKTLKRYWTMNAGRKIFCTTDNSTKPCVTNDPVVNVKITKANLFKAISCVIPDFYQFFSLNYISKKDLLEIAEDKNLIFEEKTAKKS